MSRKKLNLFDKMSINTTLNYSPNFDPKKRKFNKIKFIIFHYTGMKNEKDAIQRLTNIKSKVFNGLTKIEQHKLVYKSLKGKMGNELHALSITTEENK